jgi:hypothetical protein
MATRAGVGKSTNKKSFDAGREAALQAMEQLGDGPVDLVIVFGTTGYDQAALLQGVADVTGTSPLTGSSAEGVITQTGSDEGSHAVTVQVIRSDALKFQTLIAEGVSSNAAGCGKTLAEAIAAIPDGKLLLVFPDGMTANCSELLGAIDAHKPAGVTVAGGGAGEMMRFEKTYQYHDGKAYNDAVAAVLISGSVQADVIVSHGCEPIGVEHTVTKAEGPFVVEIDDEPAWDLFREYCEDDPEDLMSAEVVYLCIGERLPADLASDYDEFIIRTPFGLDKDRGALFYPGGIAEGTTVQLTRRDANKIHDRLVQSVDRLVSRHPGQKPALVFQFDCCGRGRLIFGEKTTEVTIDPMQQAIGKDVPWVGFHCYGEIAPIKQKTYYHNNTVVLCALYD